MIPARPAGRGGQWIPPVPAPAAGARRLTAVLLVAGALLVGLALWLDPATSGLFPACPFRAATGGLHCPGCGTLRALHALGQGDLWAAFALNPVAMLALPAVGWGLWQALRRRRPAGPPRPGTRWLGWGVLALLVLWWVVRNLVGTAA